MKRKRKRKGIEAFFEDRYEMIINKIPWKWYVVVMATLSLTLVFILPDK